MLTFGCARAHRRSRSASIGAAFVLAVIASTARLHAAQAQEIESGGCIGSWKSFNCVTRWAPEGNPFVRLVPPPADATEDARTKERERRWVDRCRPVIMQDRYGVARYHYAMPGCEFGVGEY